jgi:phosphate-selective porin
VAARLAYLDLDGGPNPADPAGPAGGVVVTATAGLTWYLADHFRVMADYTYFRTQDPSQGWGAGAVYGVRAAAFW